ncbi:MAG: hypothetical protein KKF44_07625 [Nanoarchaeota archaeon]|nr:hypothetical protein [Nanoarchaeota archaeon]
MLEKKIIDVPAITKNKEEKKECNDESALYFVKILQRHPFSDTGFCFCRKK